MKRENQEMKAELLAIRNSPRLAIGWKITFVRTFHAYFTMLSHLYKMHEI